MVKIEVVYVNQDGIVFHVTLNLEEGATVADALKNSEVFSIHPECEGSAVGIYAKSVSLDRLLKNGDRIEIYRPLLRDPKEKRRQLAVKARKEKSRN